MAGAFRCHCALCIRVVQSASYICKQCLADAKGVNHVLDATREHVPQLFRAPPPVIASRMWARLAPECGKALAEDLVKRYHAAWQLELFEKPDLDWVG